MKKLLMACLTSVMLSVGFTSCTIDDDPIINPEVPEITIGIYVLNSGKFGNNNASLTLYSTSEAKSYQDFFYTQNNQKLGDTAQDMLVYGSKMYIAVYGSHVMFVTDKDGKLIKEIPLKDNEGQSLSPRSLASNNGHVYFSDYEGLVTKMDTVNFEMQHVAVGPNPEGIIVVGNKLYVANSDGMNSSNGYENGKSVSVIDLTTFTETKKIEIPVINPSEMIADEEGDIYLISLGNYADIPNTLQRIDTKTDKVEIVKDVHATFMAKGQNDKMYIVSSVYDANWKQTISYFVFDMKTETLEGDFIKDGTVVEKAYSISCDPLNGYVYIATSDYLNDGDVYVFYPEGQIITKFEVGLNPMVSCFVTNK